MFCPHCHADLYNDAESCPRCGLPTNKPVRKRFNLLKFLVVSSDHLTLVMNGLNIYLLVTGAHYVEHMEYGLMISHFISRAVHPAITATDIIFGILLLIIPIISSLGHYYMKRYRRFGFLMAAYSAAALTLWSILYPFVIFVITDIISPVLMFVIIQTLVYASISAVIFLYLHHTDRFIY